MHNIKLVVRWNDKEGKSHRREYDDEPKARKARDWLMENGASDVDIAISSNRGERVRQNSK